MTRIPLMWKCKNYNFMVSVLIKMQRVLDKYNSPYLYKLNIHDIVLSNLNVAYNRNHSICSYYSESMFNLLSVYWNSGFFFLYECLISLPINVKNQIWYQIQKQQWFQKSTNETNIYFSILVWEFKAISISSYSFYSVIIYALAYTCA